jgi:heme exporter protein D
MGGSAAVKLGEFLAMGGYGFYVWGSYLVTLVLIVIEVVAVRARLRKAHAAAEAEGELPR